MELTGIEEQIGVMVRKEAEAEVEALLKPIWRFLEDNNVRRKATPFNVRSKSGQFEKVTESQQMYWKLKTYFTDLIAEDRTQKKLNEAAKKLMLAAL